MEGAQIVELRRQVQRFIDEKNALTRTIQESAEILNNISVTINAQSDLGRGVANLARRSQEISMNANSKLEFLAIFMNERINVAEAGIAQSSATLSQLTGRLQSLDF